MRLLRDEASCDQACSSTAIPGRALGLVVRGRTRALPKSAKNAKKKTFTSGPLRITAAVRESLEMSDDVEEQLFDEHPRAAARAAGLDC